MDVNTPELFHEKNRQSFRLPLLHYYRDPYETFHASQYEYKIFHFTGGTLDNYSTTETLFDDNGNVTLVTETETDYDYDKHYQPSTVTTVTSDGIPVIQTFTYPQDDSNPTGAINSLILANRHVPLEVETFKDIDDDGVAETNERLNFTKTTYYDWGNGIIEPSLIQTAKNTETLQDRIEFKDYDSRGNLLQVSRTDGMDICYIYGYGNTLPVAKIENATYTQMQSYVAGIQNASNADDDHCMDSGSCNEKVLRTALNNLRAAFPNAMVTTYTYDPLIGVTSMTDPKGYTVYYEYDGLNRLERVKDADGNIMSENKYHYLLDN